MATHQTGEREYPVLVASWSEVLQTCEEQIRYEQSVFVAELLMAERHEAEQAKTDF